MSHRGYIKFYGNKLNNHDFTFKKKITSNFNWSPIVRTIVDRHCLPPFFIILARFSTVIVIFRCWYINITWSMMCCIEELRVV